VAPEKLTLTTFGSPRALQTEAANYVNSFSFPKMRLVNRNDPVPSLPPAVVSALSLAPACPIPYAPLALTCTNLIFARPPRVNTASMVTFTWGRCCATSAMRPITARRTWGC
jgi:hypothetical protein